MLCQQAMVRPVCSVLLCSSCLVLPSHPCPPLGQRSPFSFQPRTGAQAASQGPLCLGVDHTSKAHLPRPRRAPWPSPPLLQPGRQPPVLPGPQQALPGQELCGGGLWMLWWGRSSVHSSCSELPGVIFCRAFSSCRTPMLAGTPYRPDTSLSSQGGETPPGSGRDEGCW